MISISDDKKYSVGLLIGGIGQSEDKTECESTYMSNCIGGGGFGLSFGDDENTNGAALMYTYNFNGLHNSEWRLGMMIGYG